MQLFRVQARERRGAWRAVACGALATMLGLSTSPAGPATAQAAEAAGVTCTDVSMPVTISGGSVPIVGRLCLPDGAKVVQVLVHGITWGQYYWDFPYQPERYSYVRAANAAGYATLNISRLGHGASAHPFSGQVTFESNASSVHQVVQALRRGDLGAQFDKVVLVGHSIGALISWLEAGTYQDVDAVVATAVTHKASLEGLAVDSLRYYPAGLDPKFANSNLDVGYVTTLRGARSAYYEASNTDPAVIALDEQLKETGTQFERITALPEIILSHSKNINVPVFVVVGRQEPEFCDGVTSADCSSSVTLTAGERPFYGPNATVDGLVVPNANHNVTLHLTAPQTNQSILTWMNQRVGTA
jgi:pimeloyl-ACP methyl ester carboxylesterase